MARERVYSMDVYEITVTSTGVEFGHDCRGVWSESHETAIDTIECEIAVLKAARKAAKKAMKKAAMKELWRKYEAKG